MTWWENLEYGLTEEQQFEVDRLAEQVAREIRWQRYTHWFEKHYQPRD